MSHRAVLLDFYGTLAEMTHGADTWESVLAEFGYTLDPEVRDRWWNDGLDGLEHDEHSISRDHYVAWQHQRTRGLLDDCGVPLTVQDIAIARVREMFDARRIAAYEETAAVLAELRERGLILAICSNWDWDLHEAVAAAGLTDTVDVVVSSAWVGARKPHARIYAHTLDQIGVDPEHTWFVGDTWACDVEGPLRAGMRPVYLRRSHFGTDATAPEDHRSRAGIEHAKDLHSLLDILGR